MDSMGKTDSRPPARIFRVGVLASNTTRVYSLGGKKLR